MAAIEVEETIRRIASHKGVEGIVVCNFEGVSLKSTLSKELSTQYAGLMAQLVVKARSVLRTIDTDDDLVFLRARTKKHEVMIAPGDGYLLIVRVVCGLGCTRALRFCSEGWVFGGPACRAWPAPHAPAPLPPTTTLPCRSSKSFEEPAEARPVLAAPQGARAALGQRRLGTARPPRGRGWQRPGARAPAARRLVPVYAPKTKALFYFGAPTPPPPAFAPPPARTAAPRAAAPRRRRRRPHTAARARAAP